MKSTTRKTVGVVIGLGIGIGSIFGIGAANAATGDTTVSGASLATNVFPNGNKAAFPTVHVQCSKGWTPPSQSLIPCL